MRNVCDDLYHFPFLNFSQFIMSHLLVTTIELQPSRSRNHIIQVPAGETQAIADFTAFLRLTEVAQNSTNHDTTPVIDHTTDRLQGRLQTSKMIILVAALAGVTFLASLCNAMIGIAAPVIAKNLHLDAGLLLW